MAFNLASGFGFQIADGVPHLEGSWVDNLKVRTFGTKAVAVLGSRDWQIFE